MTIELNEVEAAALLRAVGEFKYAAMVRRGVAVDDPSVDTVTRVQARVELALADSFRNAGSTYSDALDKAFEYSKEGWGVSYAA